MIDLSKYSKFAEVQDGKFVHLEYEGAWCCIVYLVQVGDEYYIGSTTYPSKRMRQHLKELLSQTHFSSAFQLKWDQCKSFSAYILNNENIPKKELRAKEKEYIAMLQPSLNGMVARKRNIDLHKVHISIPEDAYYILYMKKTSCNLKRHRHQKEISISQIISEIIEKWISENWDELEDELKVIYPSMFPKTEE